MFSALTMNSATIKIMPRGKAKNQQSLRRGTMKKNSLGESFACLIRHALSLLLFAYFGASQAAAPLRSLHALVVDDATGEILLQKDADVAVPIASLTKLMTAVVVLDAVQPMDQSIRIERSDLYSMGRT